MVLPLPLLCNINIDPQGCLPALLQFPAACRPSMHAQLHRKSGFFLSRGAFRNRPPSNYFKSS
jgi:hypothetical protein